MRSTWPDSRFQFPRRDRLPDLAAHDTPTTSSRRLRDQLAQKFAQLTTSRSLPLYLAFLTATLVLPSLFIGFQLDDYLQRYCGAALPGSERYCAPPLSLFAYASGDPERMHRMIETGFAPFWAYDRLVIDFLRPVSALTHVMDYRLWPSSPAIMHAESIAWLMGAVFLATVFFRATMGIGVVSAAAAFAFAVDHVHGLPVGWIANRNAVMAALFGTAALVAYDRGRREGSSRTASVGVPCLVLALLSGEIALGAWGYLLAHALVLDRSPLRDRLRALLPYVIATVAWRVAYTATGHGAIGSDLYLDPAREPLAFLRLLPERLPLLLLGVFGFPPAEAAFFTTAGLSRWGIVASVVFAISIGAAYAKLVRSDRLARFWATGMLLSLLPACSAVPHNRLLYFPSLGGMALLAILIDAFAKQDPRLPEGVTRGVSRIFAALSGGLHAFVSPLLLPLAACAVSLTHSIADHDIPSAVATMSDVPHQDLIMVTAPEYYVGTYVRAVLGDAGRPEPAHVRLLSVGPVGIRARRLDAHTLELTYDGLLAPAPMRLFSSARNPMAAGSEIKLDGVTIDVTRVTSDGRPATATFRFTEPLDSPRLRWVTWQKDHFVKFAPPAADGAVVEVPRAVSGYTIG
jgi:hypothetical protein